MTATIGHNQNPLAAFDAIKSHMDDLLTEARNWADGEPVQNDAQAGVIDQLIDDLRLAAAVADNVRKDEVAPLDEARDLIQARYNEYIAPLKNKKPGRVSVAVDVLKAVIGPWRKAKLDAATAVAEAARKEAAQKAAEAAEAMRASTVDLNAREAAEALVQAAQEASHAAARAERATTTGTGLTTYYEAVMTVQKEAVLHYMKSHPTEFIALAQRLADQDVRGGKRSIPGFSVEERKRAR